MSSPSGNLTRVVGTIAVLAGIVVFFLNWERPDYQNGFLVGAMLIFGGLLLRIEAAVLSRNARPDQGS